MNHHLEKNCEGVDASVFSGDVLYDDESRAELKNYIGRWTRAIAEHEGAAVQAAQPEAVGDERLLRTMLAIRVAGPTLYADDGELQDNSAQPFIDFKRDSAKEIERKLMERGTANAWKSIGQFAAAPTTEATSSPSDADRYRLVRRGQHWSVIDGIGTVLRGDDLDSAADAILADAAIRATKGGEL